MKLKLALIFSFTTSICFSQTPNFSVEVAKAEFKAKQVVPPTPNAAELGKYGNVPVSLFSGTPNISSPLVELKGNFISLPVSLSYNASGFKPEDLAPWTGSGWSLNAGGVITRSVIGNPDNNSNYFGSTTALNPPSSSSFFPYRDYMSNIQTGVLEGQPDVYYYNFAGMSGKFFINPDGTVLKKGKNLDSIRHTITANDVSSFTIIDDKGFTYTFSTVEMTRTVPIDDQGQPLNMQTYLYPSSWFLTQIISPDGIEKILFDYYSTTGEQTLYLNTLQNESKTHKFSENTDCFTTYSSSASSYSAIPPNTYAQRKFLNKITLKRNDVVIAFLDVISSTGRQDSEFTEDRKVDQLKFYSVINNTNTLIKQYNLTYNYFINNVNIYYKKRLRLDAVQEMSVDGVTPSKPPHSFTYNNALSMPERFTASLDHWGFYNTASNTSLVPNASVPYPNPTYNYPPTTFGGGADREPNIDGASCTILNKITYPTGGYSTFEYELNQAKFDDNTIHPVGGLRIKKIIDYSFENKKATAKNYAYTLDNGTTSGRAGIYPVYLKQTTYLSYLIPHLCPCDPCERDMHTISYTLTTNSIFGLGSIQGSHVGYSMVTESQSDVNNDQPLGKTVYKYQIGQFYEHDDDLASGDLIQQSVYNNAGKLLTDVTNAYQYSFDGVIYSYLPKPLDQQTSKTKWCRTSTNDYINYGSWENAPSGCVEYRNVDTKQYLDSYGQWSQKKLLIQQVEKVYDQLSNSYVTNTKNFTYGNTAHMYPTKIDQTTTAGEMVVTQKKYAADYSLTGGFSSDANAIGVLNLKAKNMMGTEVESVQYRQNGDGNNKRYVGGALTTFLPSSPYPEKVYQLQLSSPASAYTASIINGSGVFTYDAAYKVVGSFTYDLTAGTLVEQSKEKDVVTSYIWGYRNSYPVAQISGVPSSTILGNSGLNAVLLSDPTSDDALRIELDKIRTANNTALVTTYTYKPLVGLTSQTDQNKRTTYYEYDGLERLVNIKDHDLNIVKNFKYNYNLGASVASSAPTLFYSGALQGNFTRTSCTGGMKALPVSYSVPYGKYVSSISQPDADAKANTDYTTNGQALANAQPCLYYNAATSGPFTRTNCGSGDMGLSVTYTVPADKYSSSNTQTEADQLATADKTTNGPIYANANAICVPAVTINYSNYASTFLSATYTRSTGEVYKFKLFPGSGTVNVPQGTYTVLVSCSETYPLFNLGCLSATGSPYTFYNVNVSASTCNTLSVSLYN
jgi:YD repeat-containing protein